MSALQYSNYPGAGQKQSDFAHYSQAVRLPGTGIVKCSGQGGWDSETAALDGDDYEGQVDRAFKNVELALQAAGLRGWSDVYLLRTYHVGMDQSFPRTVEMLKKHCPTHRPVWTAVAVPRLVDPKMLIEVEVEAFEESE